MHRAWIDGLSMHMSYIDTLSMHRSCGLMFVIWIRWGLDILCLFRDFVECDEEVNWLVFGALLWFSQLWEWSNYCTTTRVCITHGVVMWKGTRFRSTLLSYAHIGATLRIFTLWCSTLCVHKTQHYSYRSHDCCSITSHFVFYHFWKV